jgi:hypothetical protein
VISPNRPVLLLDGPHAGVLVHAMPDAITVVMTEPHSLDTLHYRISVIGFHHGGTQFMIRIATLNPDYGGDELMEAMLSDLAKQAVFGVGPVHELQFGTN